LASRSLSESQIMSVSLTYFQGNPLFMGTLSLADTDSAPTAGD
jgi:hypothetical protein